MKSFYGRDKIVPNERRHIDGLLICWNCGAEFDPALAIEVTSLPLYFNQNRKELCDVECLLSYAKQNMYEDVFPCYQNELELHLKRQVRLLPSRYELMGKGGTLTWEEYKNKAPALMPSSRKLQKIEDANQDVEMID